ncbi:MAG: hypothetical protein LZF86_250039 [Nitrospira sp.]|nr:MAG: hypothetical protein LZF86_250039 [Nitrospira sp.]
MGMRYLTTAQDVGELGFIKSLCEANGIVCLFQDEHVSSLYPGVFDLCCQVMVDESQWERATTLISRLRLPIREVSPSS